MSQEQGNDTPDLSKLLEELGKAKDHFVKAQTEIFLALRSALDVLVTVLPVRHEESSKDSWNDLFLIIRSFLENLINWLRSEGDEDQVQTKEEALKIIRRVLEEEKHRSTDEKTPNILKIKTLEEII